MKMKTFLVGLAVLIVGVGVLHAQQKLKTKPVRKQPVKVKPAPRLPSNVKQKPDPHKIPVTPARLFEINDRQVGTSFRGYSIGMLQRKDRSFVLAYEAVVDSINGGHTQGLLSFLSPTLQQRGAVMPFTSKHTDSVLHSITLKEFADGRFVLVYREVSQKKWSPSTLYYVVYSKNGRPVQKRPAVLFKLKKNLYLNDVTMMPGGKAAMVTCNVDSKSYMLVVGSNGKIIHPAKQLRGLHIRNVQDKIRKEPLLTAPLKRLSDGQLLAGLSCYDASGFASLDAYGQFTSEFHHFKPKGAKELGRGIRDFLILPKSNFQRYLLHLDDDSFVVMNEPSYQSTVHHQFSPEIKVLGVQHRIFVFDKTQALICYNKRVGTGNYNYEVRALLIDHAGSVKKPDQVILSGVSQILAMQRLASGDILVVGSGGTTPSTFKCVLIPKPAGN